jgi:hypothetical protein
MRWPEKTSRVRLIGVAATVGVKREKDIRNRWGLIENI